MRKMMMYLGVAVILSACATSEVQKRLAAVKADETLYSAVGTALNERVLQECREHPDTCKRRWYAIRQTWQDPLVWRQSILPPPNRVSELEIEEWARRVSPDNMPRIAEIRHWRAGLFTAMEDGRLTEEQAKAIYAEREDRVAAQARAYINGLEQARIQAQIEDLRTFVSVLAAAGAVAGAVAGTQGVNEPVPNAAPSQWRPVPAPTVTHCTYRLWALGGQMLCAMSDGSVVAR